jgi:hypothetical protein
LLLAASGCSIAPFQKGTPAPGAEPGHRTAGSGSGPVLTAPTDIQPPPPEQVIEAPPPVQLPKERPRTPAATLTPASRALVNPLLWIEMGRLRMDQQNYPQAENMGRKALSMSVGDDRTQSAAWQLVGDSLKARGKNPQAQAAYDKSKALSTR